MDFRIGWYRREGIAIDGSSEHFISGNDIIDGALGGIMLYKNCWEHRYTMEAVLGAACEGERDKTITSRDNPSACGWRLVNHGI